MPKKEYLGDGVYAQVEADGFSLVLTTEDGISCTNTIYLELPVIGALIEYLKRNKLCPTLVP